jgi:hypothetical protein
MPKKVDVSTQAEKRFRKTGDFRFVALAIGERPHDPPDWALWACRWAYWLNQQQAFGTGQTATHGAMLDEMIQFYHHAQMQHSDVEGYRPPPLARAMAHALARVKNLTREDQPALYQREERKLRRAWQRELRHGTPCMNNPPLIGFAKATERMAIVLGGCDIQGLSVSRVPHDISRAIISSDK